MGTTIANLSHEALRQLLGAYALGVTTAEEARALELHLQDCDECQAEFGALLAAAFALPLAVAEMEPPARLRQSILAAIEAEPRSAPAARRPLEASVKPTAVPVSIESKRNRWLPWAVAAVLLVASIGLLGWNYDLRNDDDPAASTVALVPADATSSAGGDVSYLEEDGVILMSTHNLPEIAEDQVFQVWLIEGDNVQSAGVMPTDSDQFAVSADPDDYDLIAVTVEQGPIGVAAPSTAPILTGELETIA